MDSSLEGVFVFDNSGVVEESLTSEGDRVLHWNFIISYDYSGTYPKSK